MDNYQEKGKKVASKWGVVLGGAVIWLVLAGNTAKAGSPGNDAMLEQGVKNFQQENYDEALAELTQAWDRGPKTPIKAFYLGMINYRMGNYGAAENFLKKAVSLKKDFHEAKFQLASLLIGLEKADQAMPYLEELANAGFQPAPTAMLLGQATTKQKQYAKAVQYFRQAQEDPGLAQEAKVQESLALAAQDQPQEAKKVLESAIVQDPNSPAAGFAQRYVDTLDRRIKDTQPFHFNVTGVFDYDSNVTLQPGDTGAAQAVAGRGDFVMTQIANMDYQFFPTGTYGLMAQYSFFQNFHRRLTRYDILSQTFGLIPSVRFPQGTLWLPFNYNYTDLQSEKYYTGFTLTPTYLHMLNQKWGVELGTKYSRQYFWWPLPFNQEDRSGKYYGGSLGAYYFIKKQKGYFQARLIYERADSGGSNWDSSTYHLLLAALYPATDNLKFSGFIDLSMQPFDNRWYNGNPYIVNPSRFDKILMLGVQGTYEFYKGLEINLHYYYIRDNSNLPLYDYNRHIWGAQIGYRY